MSKLFVTLANVGNPDRDENADRPLAGVPCSTVEVASILEASQACRDYITEHGLGGGNWSGGAVTDESGAVVAKVSYNGRIWNPDGSEYDGTY